MTTSVQGLQATTGYTSLLSSEATTGYTSLLSSEATTGYICFWPAIKSFHPLECAHWVCAAAVRPKVFLQPPSNELCVSINLEATNGTFPFFEQPLTNLLCISIIAQQPSNQLCISTMVSAHVQFAVHEESWIQWLTPGQQSTENSMT